MASQRIANNDGVQDALLNGNKSSTPKLIINGLSKKEQTLAENILNNIFQSYITRDTYELNLHSKNIDATLGRIASLLDEVKQSFTSNELESVKQAIITVLNNELNNITNKFDQISLKNIINDIILQIELVQTTIIENAKLLLRQFITEQNKQTKEKINNSTQQFITDAVEKITDKQNENADKIVEEIESNQHNTVKVEKQPVFNVSAINDIINNEITKLQSTVNDILTNIEQNILNISSKVTQIINIVDDIADITKTLVPTTADKKKQKKDIADQEKLNKIISNITKQMDVVSDCFKNLTQIMIANLEIILNSIFKTVVAAWLKIFGAIVIPVVTLVALFLKLLAEPLMKILQPIMDFITEIVEKITDLLEPIVNSVVNALKIVFETVIENILVPFFKGMASVAKLIGQGIAILVVTLLSVLTLLMQAIKPFAFLIGQALSYLALYVIEVLALFMEGISSVAYKIGEGLGIFVKYVLRLLTLLMRGIGTIAYDIGVAVGTLVLALLNVVDLIITFCNLAVGILVDIVGCVRDFFEGIRSKAKALGVMVGTVILNFLKGIGKHAFKIGEAVGNFCLGAAKIILMILKTIQNLSRWTQLYIIAPIKALFLKIDAIVMQASDFTIRFPNGFDYKIDISWKKGVSFDWWLTYKEIKPLSFLTDDWDEERKRKARAAKGKSISELVDEEQAELQKKFAAEDEAMRLNKARAALDEKNMDLIVDNISMFDDMFALTKSLYEQIYGKENTEKFLSSVKSKFESLDEVKKINEQNAKMKEEISKKLEEKNNFIKQFEKYDQMEEHYLKEQRFLDEFIQFMKTNFEKTTEYLENNPSVIALPSNNANLYNED